MSQLSSRSTSIVDSHASPASGAISEPAVPGRPLRLCFVVAATNGVTSVVSTLRELRVQFGYDISAVVKDVNSPLADRLRDAGVTVYELDFQFDAFPGWWGLAVRSARLARLFSRERFDVVLTCLWHSMLVGRLAGWLADVPVRLTRIAGPLHLEAPLGRWVDARTCWIDHVVIGVCEQILEIYRELGLPERRLRLMHSARDVADLDPSVTRPAGLRDELGLPADTPLIGMVSWFYRPVPPSYWSPLHLWDTAVKGHETLIEAATIVARELPSARFVMVGSGWDDEGDRYMARMQALAEERGVSDRVFFLGARPDVPAIYRDLDVAAHPSRSEGAGGAIESLLMACPTVGTRIGGIVDVVIDGETGVLVDVDDPDDLARGILGLLRDRPRAETLARAGRAHVARLSDLAAGVRVIDALCRRILDGSGSRGRGYRPIVRISRLAALGPFCLFLDYGMRVVEARCRLQAIRGQVTSRASSYLDAGLLVAVGPVRQQAVAGSIRQRAAVARGSAKSLYQQWHPRLAWARGTVKGWRQQAECAVFRALADVSRLSSR